MIQTLSLCPQLLFVNKATIYHMCRSQLTEFRGQVTGTSPREKFYHKFTHFCEWLFTSLQCSDTVGWQEGHPARKKLGVGLLAVTFRLELCTSYCSSCYHSPPPSSLAPIKSRMETIWYRLTQVHLEKWLLKQGERVNGFTVLTC